jgi:hypothetical protein
MGKALKIIKKWWEGEYIDPPHDNSSIVILLGRQKYPLIRRILTIIAEFWVKHWKWIIGTAIIGFVAVWNQ